MLASRLEKPSNGPWPETWLTAVHYLSTSAERPALMALQQGGGSSTNHVVCKALLGIDLERSSSPMPGIPVHTRARQTHHGGRDRLCQRASTAPPTLPRNTCVND